MMMSCVNFFLAKVSFLVPIRRPFGNENMRRNGGTQMKNKSRPKSK